MSIVLFGRPVELRGDAVKRLSICLTVVPLFGFTGPCMESSSSTPSNHNEASDEPSIAPPNQSNQIEPTAPEPTTLASVPPAPTPTPPSPALPPSSLPPPAPPPIPEPAPEITEPPLTPFTCQDFASLPLVGLPARQIVHSLAPNEDLLLAQSVL